MTYTEAPTDRNPAIRTIRAALKRRSGKTWSVRGDRGTAWGWIIISSPPARSADKWGTMTPEEAAELGALLGFDHPVHCQGVTIADGRDYRQAYIDRAEGRPVSVAARQYWD